MHLSQILQIVVFLTILTVFAVILGEYMAKVFQGENTWFSPIFNPIEKLLYKLLGVDETKEMDWKTYL